VAQPGWIEAIRKRDPAGVALRRGIRVAIAVPLSLLILTNIPGLDGSAPLFGVFATLALLVFADFGGTLPTRATAYLAAVVTAVPILWVGITFGQSVAGAVAVMAFVALLLGMLAVLRGVVASAQTTLLLATVLAVTSAPAGSQWQVIACWVIGGLIATAAAVLMWPARPHRVIRELTARALAQNALAIRQRWVQSDPQALEEALARLDETLAQLNKSYVGNLMRPSGLTQSDRQLSELVDIAARLRRYQRWVDVVPADAAPQPELIAAKSTFAATVAHQLDRISARMLDGRTEVSPELLQRARDANLTVASDWTASARTTSPPDVVRQHLDDMFPVRLTSVVAELAAANAGDRSDFHDATLGEELEHPRRGALVRLRAHTSWDSPWFRSALRAAVALGLSVGIAKTLSLGHEFWIVLGTLTALRFDALGTGRTAIQALAGTTLGVVVAGALILVFAQESAVWWILLPPTLFLAAFTPGTFSLATGQASFSLVVLVLFSLLFPPTIATAELRLEEVIIGLCVSLFISMVMWPRGVVATLYQRMREGMDAATDHLVMAVDHVAGGAVDERILRHFRQRSSDAMERAQEAYDLSVAQRPPKNIPLREWARVAVACRHVDAAARLIPGVRHMAWMRGEERPVPNELIGPLLETSQAMRDQLRDALSTWQVATITEEESATPGYDDPFVVPPPVADLRSAVERWLAEKPQWHGDTADPRPAIVAWLADWTAFISWNASLLRRELTPSTP
jgi:uncharacterized membrane protein YccC